MRIPDRASDVETATLRYLLYGLLPAWFVPGLLDWWQHRRTRIEDTAGVRESLIHLLMMAEVGLPIALALLCEINPLVLTIMAATIAAHEATALWDVKTAVDSSREVTPIEQHIHSFLESLPFMGTAAIACLHWKDARELLHAGDRRGAWRLQLKRHRLPGGYLAAIAAAVGGLIAVPYGEELRRCVRTATNMTEMGESIR
ncbi:diguanylate cyclase/phosphodiesterase [Amycolatopsis rubida]|uniref:Diguanylate cyclase/phosphodiesterase n=1 Tax=Amycolatopsis rubida TaxID=112413 RepID=A0ABX0BUE3_9PSEU|nr:diguanylate cyclase/phosphodiesterase [Amycolatopsis rubida]NEC59166.1 diguanylate cyclase/phosphodiesterase [Amycolatopsis rubida]